MIGTVIRGRYRLDAVVGTGAFATVYRAHDERLEADVALKVLAENHSLSTDVRERFINEARRLRQVASPHVVGIHDLGETDRYQPFIVMDLADRGDLARRVADHRANSRQVVPEDLLAVASTLAGALAAMHAHRVVHRDLTPRNLLLASTPSVSPTPDRTSRGIVGSDERLLVGDLGLSKDLALASGITAAVGTPGFSPPEQRIGAGIDERTDVYAASALLVWLVTGQVPADDGTWPSAAFGGWPQGIVSTLSRGLSRAPGDRHATAAEWEAEVRAALAPAELSPTLPAPALPGPVAGTEHPSSSPGQRRRARRGLVVVVALIAVLAGGAGGRLLATDDDDGSGSRTEEIGSGRVRAEASEGDLTVSVEGPETLTVGEPSSFTADVGDAESWVWVGPDGRISPDAPSLDVTPGSEGQLAITLVASDGTGRTVRAVLRVRAGDR
ncbi:serine/threonine-protein kinase [Iamia sp.]|uniref:serine/threonine-protein kinase n=1 Tax=Iamia sp. TaxID=2722710 RepID=UPI002BA7CA89|nr:serine/threonine-protein kinase [Iamia sp.]HXH58874.1 serine/threonine-protein kinase [Iamia sp.]